MKTFRRSYVQGTYLRTKSADLIVENEEGAMMPHTVASGPENGNDTIPEGAWPLSADIPVRNIAPLLLLRESKAPHLLRLHDGRFGAKPITPSATRPECLIIDCRQPLGMGCDRSRYRMERYTLR